VIISVIYLLIRCLLGCLMVLTRHQLSKDAELLVLRTRTRRFAVRSAGPLPAGRPAVAGSTVGTGSPPPVGSGVRGDPGDAARLAPAAGRTQMGLHQPPVSRTAVHSRRDP
jgi:hypothetical protein